MPVLVVVEPDRQVINNTTPFVVMAACHISMYADGQIHVLVLGYETQHAVAQLCGLIGVSKVLVADARHLDMGMTENHASQIQAVMAVGKYSHVLLASTRSAKEVVKHLSDKIGVVPVQDVRKVISCKSYECESSPDGGNTTTCGVGAPQVLTIDSSAFDATTCEGAICDIQRLSPLRDPLSADD